MNILDLIITCESCQFRHVGRKTNVMAHVIAKWDGQIGFGYV